jgi:hypothetical protein
MVKVEENHFIRSQIALFQHENHDNDENVDSNKIEHEEEFINSSAGCIDASIYSAFSSTFMICSALASHPV